MKYALIVVAHLTVIQNLAKVLLGLLICNVV